MDDFVNDLEEGQSYNQPRQTNKKMKKRKQLDALLKFRSFASRSTRGTSRLPNDEHPTSEDELFLPGQKTTSMRLHRSRYRRWWSYTRHILSVCLVCIFMIVCVGLAYANVELKNEVHNLSSRVTDIEKQFSTLEINRLLSSIEQIRTRLNVIERWNVSYIYDRLHRLQRDFHQMKRPANAMPESSTETWNNDDGDVSSKLDKIEHQSKEFAEVAHELDKLGRDADHQATEVIEEKSKPFDRNLIEYLLEQERQVKAHQDTHQLSKFIRLLNETLSTNAATYKTELNALRNELQSSNQSIKIQELQKQFEEWNGFVQNYSNETSAVLTALQLNLDTLRNQIEACKCSKVNGASTTVPSKDPTKQDSEKTADLNQTIDVAQIVNPPSIPR